MIVLAPTAFKGTLSPRDASRVMRRAARRLFPHRSIVECPLADGGDGTLDVLMAALKGTVHHTWVKGPLGRPVYARWGKLPHAAGLKGPVGVIEMAEASGLRLIRGTNKIREATTEGTGQLIQAAIRSGCRSLLIGVGGTACSEGGAGALHQLGFRFRDRDGNSLSPTPSSLKNLDHVDASHVDPRLGKISIFVLCDVTNPLLGARGSARVFGPQKGATPADVKFLESVLKKLSSRASHKTAAYSGAGAAGGLAFGLSGFLGARLQPGGPFILKAVGWKNKIHEARLILTGEGRLDETSFSGKVIGAVCRASGSVPVVAVCGSTPLKKSELVRRGISEFEAMGNIGLINPKRELFLSTKRILMRFFHQGGGRRF